MIKFMLFSIITLASVSYARPSKSQSLIELNLDYKSQNTNLAVYKYKNKFKIKNTTTDKMLVGDLNLKDFKFIARKALKIKSKHILNCTSGSITLLKKGKRRATGCYEGSKKNDIRLRELADIMILASRKKFEPALKKSSPSK